MYRHRYDINGPAPLGKSKDITNARQAAEYRAAFAALRRARSIGD